jgi:hypothetical protein
VAGAHKPLALSEVDWRDGSLRPSETKKLVFKLARSDFIRCDLVLGALARSCGFTQANGHIGALGGAG